MTYSSIKRSLIIASGLTCCALHSAAVSANDSGWYLEPYLGLSSLSDQTGSVDASNNITGSLDTGIDSGFVSGIALGYSYNQHYSAEISWEYRSSDSESVLTQTGQSFDGNYASNIIYLNGYYHFDAMAGWRPYVGAGIGWVQEIDLDLEENATERSFSGDGDIAAQLILGADYQFQENWQFSTEVRYGLLSSVDMEGEENITGSLTDFDYNPLTFAVGLKYVF